MSRLVLNGSPRTAARQLIELLTRDNILDEEGNVNPDTVQAACQYVWQPREPDEPETMDEALNCRGVIDGKVYPPFKSPAATDGSTPKSRSETPEAISEPCTEGDESKPDDTSRTQSPRGS